MQEFSSFVSSIIGIILVSVVVENITPSGAYKKYIKFALGLIIMITVVSAVFKILSISYEVNLDDYIVKTDSENHFENEYNERIKNLFAKNLQTEIENNIKEKMNFDCDVTSSVNDEFDEISLTVKCDSTQSVYIKDYIEKTYGIRNIVIEYKEDNNAE